MKALILNSGIGSRMGNLNTCKCLTELVENVTIFDAQIQAMQRCGIEDFYVTTGSYASKLEAHARNRYPGTKFTFIPNPLYNQTNYIYSIYLARKFVQNNDILLLHGDLVFEQNVLQDIIASNKSVMVVDSAKPLPDKDFKVSVKNNRITEIGVNIFTDAFYSQPLYKLNKKDWTLWLNEIINFCEQGITNVYAENAFNKISSLINLYPFDITGRMCFEVDNKEDLNHARKSYITMPERKQTVYAGYGSIKHLKSIISGAEKPFIVCSKRGCGQIPLLRSAVYFNEFTPNPDINEVFAGIELFEKEGCDFIVSFGGGSAIDVAKSINILNEKHPRANHSAIPTTAGTGSESTSFAVIYKNGKKLSVEHENILPDYTILDPEFLSTVPTYQKKSTLSDALCQAVESVWARGKTNQSKAYALSAINLIYENINDYLQSNSKSALILLQAANLSGKAINISKTTAAHAMSYKLSDVLGITHGHAVALCLPHVWLHLLTAKKNPPELSYEQYTLFIETMASLKMCNDFQTYNDFPVLTEALLNELAESVNIQRLNNHPVNLSKQELTDMYYALSEKLEPVSKNIAKSLK